MVKTDSERCAFRTYASCYEQSMGTRARTYYTSEALGVRKRTHLPLFHAIQVNGQQIFDQASNLNSLLVTVCLNKNLIALTTHLQ